MKRLDESNNESLTSFDREKFEDISKKLNQSFQELNDELDEKWFDNISKGEDAEKQERVTSQELEKESLPYQEKTVRNNGKKVGKMCTYPKALKRTLLIASFVFVGATSFIVGRSTNRKPSYQFTYNTLSESYFDEPTYNGILYTVKSGDNLSNIVARYESDPNMQAVLIDQIMRYNDLSTSKIIDGKQIYLFGVPSSMLEEYGYSDNFNYFDPLVEINVRIDFLNKMVENVKEVDSAQDYIERIEKLKELYQQFKYSYIPGVNDELDEIMNEARKLCEEASNYGYDFDNNKKAMPLSEATKYRNPSGRTNS